jgi:hypothetical protein
MGFQLIEQNQCIFSSLFRFTRSRKHTKEESGNHRSLQVCYTMLCLFSSTLRPLPPGHRQRGDQKSDGIAAREETAAKYTRQYRTRARARRAAYPSVESRPVILCAKTPKRKKKLKMYATVMNGGCSRLPTRARSTCRQKSSGRLRRCRIRVDG